MSRTTAKLWRAREKQIQDIVAYFHVLTYAEDGFSPLDIHGGRLKLDRNYVVAFAETINARSEAGSMHPVAPISAVPRELIRDRNDVAALAGSIGEFLQVNRKAIKASRLLVDFRTPAVPEFAVLALNCALESNPDPGLKEVLILEM
jgi:hypothetical protein